MTYELLDTESHSVLASHSDKEEARADLREYVEHYPDLIDELAIASVDDDGHAVEVEPASALFEPA